MPLLDVPVKHCKSCGANIIWCINDHTGTRAPIDAAINPLGNVYIDPLKHPPQFHVVGKLDLPSADKSRLHTNHFQSCPESKAWKRKA